MSNNEHALPPLGDAVIFAVKYLPLAVIPQLIQRFEDCSECPALVVAKETFDVFK
jgi:hypothetical protein